MSNRLANILIGMFLFVVAVNYYDSHGDRLKIKLGLAPQRPVTAAIVASVISGDTFVLSNGVHVHFVAMQAPRAKECGGALATGALSELMPKGTKVILRADTRWPDQDQATLLRHVWLEDGRYLQEVLGQNGMLVPYSIAGDLGDQKPRIRRASMQGHDLKAGIWGECKTTLVSETAGARTLFNQA